MLSCRAPVVKMDAAYSDHMYGTDVVQRTRPRDLKVIFERGYGPNLHISLLVADLSPEDLTRSFVVN